MARRGGIKGVEVVGSKSMARKRSTEESVGERAKKRRIRAVEEHRCDEQNQDQEQAVEEKVFRFMDLPGELRNRIYAHAIECSQRSFPIIYLKAKTKTKSKFTSRSSPSSSNPSSTANDPPPPIPHLGLTQTSSQIRSEFRPAWLSTQYIPLSMIPTYLKAFYPTPKPNLSPSLRTKLESQSSPSGSLRLLVRASELANTDLIPILRHAARFPDFSIVALSMAGVEPDMLASIQALLDNATESWRGDVRRKRITQVRVVLGNVRRPVLRIVVKERWAEEWMREGITKSGKTGEWVERRGLGRVAETWQLAFGVEYS